MRICVIGSGYVGLVTGVCLANSGNHVVCVDNDASKVEALSSGHSVIFQPGLDDMLRENLHANRIRFSTDLRQAVSESRVVFVAVGTPSMPDGSCDLSAVERVAQEIGQAMIGFTVVVVKSTVMVGTCDRIEEIIRKQTSQPFHVVSNPEFLKEGQAVEDFNKPDRVVIGANEPEAGEIIAELYKPFVRNNKPILMMGRRAAEMTKYAANAYLASRISFINEIADMCERVDVDVDDVRRGIGSDTRIGHHFLYPGLGYGGSCFPKDVQALAYDARRAGVHCEILHAVHERNQLQRTLMVQKILARLGSNLRDKRVVVWGLAFKPNTDDLREAPSIDVIEGILKAGGAVSAHDPRAIEAAREIFGDRIEYCEDAYAPIPGADALVTCTEWMEYRSPDFDRLVAEMRQPLIFDGRNIWDAEIAARYGFEYFSVGRPPVAPKVAGAGVAVAVK